MSDSQNRILDIGYGGKVDLIESEYLLYGVADCGMKNNFALFQNPCRDVAIASLYIQIHTSIQQHLLCHLMRDRSLPTQSQI
ncbi:MULTISPECIES: hypothetical protein [unclassified Nostoc]|uniref:hypothetical protein n=1 Tax=unclassified Nostoc TaxID=2593658 RepID=UPI002AD32F85|nr:hypothetical protein [Nostoc sp. DedQUE03]MDZ7971354.1 hypothetical protein [Nostoc sp. DedQUE03]MDZ8043438.1 hypothetical protein [Nostoc sp. DedQUE02]